jgi:hypothetical protein
VNAAPITKTPVSRLPSRSKSARNLIIVLVVWAFMVVVALELVHRYGTRTLPQYDELWALYDAHANNSVQWLWQTWAEHRIPVAKLIWKSVLELTDYDFRAGNFVTVFGLGVIALAMIHTAKRVRGHTIIADAFFPLSILNFGQAQVFLWWWQVNHVLAPIAASLLLSVLVIYGNRMGPLHTRLTAAGLILLVFCGPGGLPYVAALGMWLIIWVASNWSLFDASRRKNSLLVVALVAIAFGLLGFYFVGYQPYFPVNDPPSVSSWAPAPGPMTTAIACLQILGVSLGTATKPYAALCGTAILGLSLLSVAMLVQWYEKNPSQRSRALGLMMFLGAAAGLVFVIGRSRAGMGLDYIYQGHYLTIVAPTLSCIYFVWEIRGGVVGRSVQYGMLLALASLAPFNLSQAIQTGKSIQANSVAFERDVQKGIPAFVLAERHFASDLVPRPQKLTHILKDHKAKGVGIFKEIRNDPPFNIDTLGVQTAVLNRGVLHGDIVSSDDGMTSLTFNLGSARRVYAIRLSYVYIESTSLSPNLRVYWRSSKVEDFNENAVLSSIVPGPNQPTWALIDSKIQTNAKIRTERTLTIWVDADIDQFRIYPDGAPCDFRLSKVQVLTPLEDGSNTSR